MYQLRSGRLIRKPMLIKRLQDSHSCEKKVIGILGVNRGVGATYTGMLLAYFFGMEKGVRTAYLECNSHQDFTRLQEAYEWSGEDEHSFTLDNITYYKQVGGSQITGILNEDYDCYILDFGTDFISYKEEFMRCGKKLIICNHWIWNMSKTILFHKSTENIRGSKNWIYMIPCADRRAILRMKNMTGIYFYGLPIEPDPTLLSKKTAGLFQSLFY